MKLYLSVVVEEYEGRQCGSTLHRTAAAAQAEADFAVSLLPNDFCGETHEVELRDTLLDELLQERMARKLRESIPRAPVHYILPHVPVPAPQWPLGVPRPPRFVASERQVVDNAAPRSALVDLVLLQELLRGRR